MSVFVLRHRNLLGKNWRPALQNIGWVLFMNFAIGLQPGARIDNFGHLGGFVGGAALSVVTGPRLKLGVKNGRYTYFDQPLWKEVYLRVRMMFEKGGKRK